jgi:energy-coupling factor transport system permease protein
VIDPRTKLALMAATGVLAVTLERPLSLALLAVVCLVPLALTPMPAVWRRRALVALVAAVWGSALSQGLFYGGFPRVPVFEAGPVVVYREGVVHGLVQSLRLVAVIGLGAWTAISTPPDRMLAALRALRVPFGVAFMAVTALRFLPETGRDLLVVRRARARRGRPILSRSPLALARQEVALLRPVMARSLRRARALAESLDSRGFDPVAPRTMRRPLVLRWSDVAMIGLAFLTAGGVVALRGLFLLYVGDVAYFPALRTLYGLIRDWL